MTRIMISRCNLDLQLSPPSSSSESTNLHGHLRTTSRDQMRILHNMIRPVYFSDPIELQAVGILLLARREMEKKFNFSRSNFRDPFVPIQLHGPSGLSLRRSLQRFLQKRRDRIQSAIPYRNALL